MLRIKYHLGDLARIGTYDHIDLSFYPFGKNLHLWMKFHSGTFALSGYLCGTGSYRNIGFVTDIASGTLEMSHESFVHVQTLDFNSAGKSGPRNFPYKSLHLIEAWHCAIPYILRRETLGCRRASLRKSAVGFAALPARA